MSIMWDQQLRKMEQVVTTEGLAAVLLSQDELQNPQAVAAGIEAARQMVADPSREEQAIKVLMSLSEILTKKTAPFIRIIPKVSCTMGLIGKNSRIN